MAVARPDFEKRIRSEIAASETELRRLEPDIDHQVIQGLVEVAYDELMPAKVHSYVPILIVHQVRDILRHRRQFAA